MFCALLMSRYQVSVYRTNGPLVGKRALEELWVLVKPKADELKIL